MAGFSIYARKCKKKNIFYAQFKTVDGTWSTAKSTGCTSRRAAENWCEEYLREHGYYTPGSNVTFAEFSRNFFDWTGEWATDKKVSGRRIGQRYCIEQNETLRAHLIPVFGKMKLSDVDRATIKTFKNDMYRTGRSGSGINKCLYALKAILSAAEERGIIRAVPRIERAVERPRPKGILTLEEVGRLFALPWPDHRSYTGNILAATTGLRLGELQALTLGDLHLDEHYITVRRSWDHRLGVLNDTPKGGRSRTIFIPERVMYELQRLIERHPYPGPDSFVFWGEKMPDRKPAETKFFTRTLYNALREIGIEEAQRRERNITFHSWRHWLNSLLINEKIPLQKIQSITGHRTDRMSQHYYHVDDMADVRQIQERIFTPRGEDIEIN